MQVHEVIVLLQVVHQNIKDSDPQRMSKNLEESVKEKKSVTIAQMPFLLHIGDLKRLQECERIVGLFKNKIIISIKVPRYK